MVWVLLSIGLLLVILNLRAINKERNSFKNVFNHTEEDMKEFDFKLSELRREFSETILELQKEIVEIKESYIHTSQKEDNNIKENKAIKENNIEYNYEISDNHKEKENAILNSDKVNRINNDKEYSSKNFIDKEENLNDNNEKNSEDMLEVDNDELKSNISNNIKIGEINRLLALGLSIEEVSEKLGIGKGEVLLIKELYLR